MFDISTLPVGGGLILGLVAYGAVSIVAGQEMGDRMIVKSGWPQACVAGIREAARPAPRPKSHVPEFRCSETLGIFGREFRALCGEFGDPDFNAPARRAEREARAAREALDRRRMDRAAAAADGQCACAARVFRSDEMIALGVYAGTARQISLGSLDDLRTGLRQALAAPQCRALGDGA